VARTPRRRLPPEERRALIEAAAAHLFAERGFAATRLEDVAAAAHVTKPMLYRHFESKKALYLALLEGHRGQLAKFLDTAGSDTLHERLPRILDTWFAFFEEHPHTWKMIFRDSSGDHEIQAFRRAVQNAAREVLAGFIVHEPEIDVPRPEVEPLAELMRSGLAGLALWWLDHPEVPRSVLVDATTRLIGSALVGSRA
jgi:AcrR family transcriptional regulator